MSALNEIDYGIRPEDNRLGHPAALGLTGVFVLVIALPGLLRECSTDAIRGAMAQIGHWQDGKVVDRLRAVEKRVDDGAWTKPIRQQIQTVLYKVFREGNRKVLVGRDGWLFHRPGIRALTGRGPALGPTHSVAKDHTLKSWEGPIPVIQHFAAQLKERGIPFVLVAVPDKAAICTFVLSPGGRPFDGHPSQRDLIRSLTAAGIHVFDPSDSFFGRNRRGSFVNSILPTDFSPLFLRQDSHAMYYVYSGLAIGLAGEIVRIAGKEYKSSDDSGGIEPETSKLHVVDLLKSDVGDLAIALDIRPLEVFSALEPLPPGLFLSKWMHRGTQEVTTPAVSDPTSPIVLLGDSNVNMYDDPSLPFYMPGAGFGSWLSAYMGRSLHIIAINGGGATAVRQRFAALPDDMVRAKKVVIWVIAERDLFMDPAVARENGVEWKRVTFNPNQSQPAGTTPGDAIVVDVTLKVKSALQDLAAANYPDAVYVAECAVEKVVTGTYAPPEMAVVLWNFRHRAIQPSAAYSPGQKLRLTLVRWETKGDLTKTNLSDDVQRFELPLLYAEKIEPR